VIEAVLPAGGGLASAAKAAHIAAVLMDGLKAVPFKAVDASGLKAVPFKAVDAPGLKAVPSCRVATPSAYARSFRLSAFRVSGGFCAVDTLGDEGLEHERGADRRGERERDGDP
jgi:hypothetical protein